MKNGKILLWGLTFCALTMNINRFELVRTTQALNSLIQELKGQSAEGDGEAAYILAIAHSPGFTLIKPALKHIVKATGAETARYFERAFELLQTNAESGKASAMYLISLYYQSGDCPVGKNIELQLDWLSKALTAGYHPAARELYAVYSDSMNKMYDLNKAVKMEAIITDYKAHGFL